MSQAPRIAIVSDPLVQRGGAERVVETLVEAFPDAPVFALLYSKNTGPASLAPIVRSSWLGSIPGASRYHRFLLPLYRDAVESFDLRGYDVLISSHHTAAKGLLRGAGQTHVCYCHTPMRALWERTREELDTLPRVARFPVRRFFSELRVWDVAAADRVDRFLANSTTTQARIAKYYGRESTVVHPPIDTEKFTPGGKPGDYYLFAARAVSYKRIDIAIAAAERSGRKLLVTGGRHRNAEPSERVRFLGHVSDSDLISLMRGARALLFPQLEDFGMTPLEMNACGRPVIAYAAGGALDTVIDGVTGVLVNQQDPEAFADAIERFEGMEFDPSALTAHAQKFGKKRFIEQMRAIVDDA